MDKLKPDDRAFVKEYMTNGNNATQALIKTKKGRTYTKGSARVAAHDKLTSPNIQKAILSIAEQIPDSLVIEKHIALLNKTEKYYDSQGNLLSEDIDTNAVKAGVDMAHKLKGSYAPDKSINLNMVAEITNPKARELAEKYEEELKKGL